MAGRRCPGTDVVAGTGSATYGVPLPPVPALMGGTTTPVPSITTQMEASMRAALTLAAAQTVMAHG